jgi:murein DD-endopeptidase MepM/ murein hydrolase activator NlpD
MSREFRPRPRLARALYYLSYARGESIRTIAVHPIAFWTFVVIAPIALLWAGATTLYISFHDDMLRALAARETEMQAAYEQRLAEARVEFDRSASRQRLDESALDSRIRQMLSRQAQLEQRGSIVAALADQRFHAAGAGHSRVGAANALNPALSAINAASPLAAPVAPPSAAQAFAPQQPDEPAAAPKPRPLDEPPQHVSAIPRASGGDADLAAAAASAGLDASAGLSLMGYSLDRMERRQSAALGEIGRAAKSDAAQLQAVVERAGLSVDALATPAPEGGVGGPYIPVVADDRALAEAGQAVALDDRLTRLLPILPLRTPLIGEAEVSSPFGFRPDPFLGRPALHPGLDFVQEYGAEIHATAAGRVVHAGLMGGYGNMVEIDHGNKLATRYAHMSEILVAEGEEVKAGALIGRIGSTGRSTGPHLHYEVRVDGEPVDPQRFLQAGAPLFASR